MTDRAYKLADRAEWEAASDVYVGSALDLADGFIHLSTADQMAETARRHYAGHTDLVLIEVDLTRLEVTWGASRGGDLFPHLYAPLPLSAARTTRRLSVDQQGVMRFEDGATGWP